MKYKIKRILLVLALGCMYTLTAQQQAQYTQYMYMPSIINPAYAGMDNQAQISFSHRTQWTGIKGAPTTQVVTFSTPLRNRLGMGVNILRDEIGPANETNVSVDISYTIPFNDEGVQLSFGMKGGMQVLNVDFSKLIVRDPNDIGLKNNINSRISPNIGVGTFLYGERWYLGLSSPNLLATTHYNRTSVSVVNKAVHVYFIGGKSFDISDDIQCKPTFVVKAVGGAPTSIDLSANFLFKERFTVGTSYRYGTAISALANFKVNRNLSIGYAYDFDTSDINYFTGGSHEVVLRYYFNRATRGIKSPTWLY